MSHSINRRQFGQHTLGLAGTFAAACTSAPDDQQPNIILCMGDDHGWDETGYNGHPYLRTPVLDEMASTGLRMDNFYSASPVCSPTRGSVITGRHPNRYGTFTANWSIRPEEISIAHILGDAGYACGHFGKWHLGPVKSESPTNPGAMGFEEWLSHDNFFELNPYLSRNGAPPEQFQGESSDIVIDEAIRFISKTKQQDRPFFTVIWFGSPHEPYSGIEKDLTLYDNLPESYRQRLVTVTGMEDGLPVKRPLNEVLQARYAEITAMDRAIGRLRQYLKKEGLRENTLLAYCGDNGVPIEANVTTPFRGQKGQVYEGGVRVPSVIEWPQRISEPRITNVNTVTSDILPTLCDIAGLSLPDRPLDGFSFKSLIDGEMSERPTPIFFWNYNNGNQGLTNLGFGTNRDTQNGLEPYIDPRLQEGTTPLVKKLGGRLTRTFLNFHHRTITEEDFFGPRAILDNRYKLVIDAQRGSDATTELFDLLNDRAEQDNLIETRPEIANNLKRQLRNWQQSVLNSLTGADYT